MAKKTTKRTHRTSHFNKAADRMGRAARSRGKAKEPKFEQPDLPGTPPAKAPEGPLQFLVSSDRGKSNDKGKSLGKVREILVMLTKPYVDRHVEAAALLNKPVHVKSIEGDRQEQCKLVRYTGAVGKDGITVKATIATGADGHKWLGRLVTVTSMQPSLPLEETAEPAKAPEPEPVGAQG